MNNNIDIVLPSPHPKQQEILQAYFTTDVKNITVSAGRRGGKSVLMSCFCIIEGLYNKKQVGYICPLYSQAKFFFNEIIKLLPPTIYTANKSDLEVTFINGGQIKFYSADGDSLDGNIRGRSYDLIVIDEAAFIPQLQEKLEGAISSTLIDRDGRLVMISSPQGKNHWFSLCQLNDGVLYRHFHYTSYDNPYVKKSVIDRFKQQYSTAQFNQEILAIAGENKDAIVDKETLDRYTITELSSLPTIVYGVDVASSHDFTSVTGLDQNGHMTYHVHLKGYDWNLIYSTLSALPNNVLKVIDSSGSGKPVYQRLQLSNENWIGMEFNTANKLELITELRIAINTGKLRFNEITAKELSTYNATLNTKTGNITHNAISGCFDDTVISLALAYKYLEESKTITVEDYMNRFSW